MKGQITVVSDLPDYLSQEPFSHDEKELDVAIGSANEPSFLQHDRISGLQRKASHTLDSTFKSS